MNKLIIWIKRVQDFKKKAKYMKLGDIRNFIYKLSIYENKYTTGVSFVV